MQSWSDLQGDSTKQAWCICNMEGGRISLKHEMSTHGSIKANEVVRSKKLYSEVMEAKSQQKLHRVNKLI
jgi:hypothetical protein